jgi:hypothetical protein
MKAVSTCGRIWELVRPCCLGLPVSATARTAAAWGAARDGGGDGIEEGTGSSLHFLFLSSPLLSFLFLFCSGQRARGSGAAMGTD